MGGSQDNRISEGCLEQVLGICPRHADVRLAEFAWQMLNEMFAGTPCPQKLSCSGNCPVKTPWRASCLACRTRAVLFLPQRACACQWACVLPLPACLAVRPCHPCHARLLLRHGVSDACHATHWNKEKINPLSPPNGPVPCPAISCAPGCMAWLLQPYPAYQPGLASTYWRWSAELGIEPFWDPSAGCWALFACLGTEATPPREALTRRSGRRDFSMHCQGSSQQGFFSTPPGPGADTAQWLQRLLHALPGSQPARRTQRPPRPGSDKAQRLQRLLPPPTCGMRGLWGGQGWRDWTCGSIGASPSCRSPACRPTTPWSTPMRLQATSGDQTPPAVGACIQRAASSTTTLDAMWRDLWGVCSLPHP